MLVGAVAHWAEGAKAKPWRQEDRLTFVNSDPGMIKLFIAWLEHAGVTPDRIRYRVSIHDTADVEAAGRYWAEVVGVSADAFQRATLKRHVTRTVGQNTGPNYHGCLVVRVNESAKEYRLVEGLWSGLSTAVDRMRSTRPTS